jgi:tRNA(Ile2) C34 agmatinyltransferase TiaS
MDSEELEKRYQQSSSALLELKSLIKQFQARLERQALILGVLKDMVVAGDKKLEQDFLDRLSAAAASKVAEKDTNVCHACGKVMSPKHTKCIYCGEARRGDLF